MSFHQIEKRRYAITVITYLVLVASGLAQSWYPRADFAGSARDDATYFSLGDYGYVLTGYQTGWIATTDGFKYHAYTDTWLPIASLPSNPRQYSCAFTINNKAYLVGGINGPVYFNDCWEYDGVLDSWNQMASIPDTGIGTCVCFALNGKGYIGTGLTKNDSIISSWWEFDPLLNSWTQKQDFPGTPRKLATGFAMNGKGYLLTGIDANDVMLKDVWEYDPLLDSWTQKNDFAGTPRFYARATSYMQDAYVAAGWDSLNLYRNDAWLYDAVLDNWTELDTIPAVGRKGVSLFNLGGSLFVTTGVTQAGNRLTETWVYTPSIGLEVYPNTSFQCYPNPSEGRVKLFSKEELFDAVMVRDPQGNLVYRESLAIPGNEWEINLEGLSPGMYFISFANHYTIMGQIKWIKK